MTEKLRLTKESPKISLEKTSTSTGTLTMNLNWAQPEVSKGFWSSLMGGGSIDLDLGCLYELADGRLGVVQALGNSFGDFTDEPFIELDGDDRSGAAVDGETIRVNLAQASKLKKLLIFAFIYEGAPSWASANGVVTVYPPTGSPVTVHLDTHENKNMCAIAMVTFENGVVSIERQVKYFNGHEDMDKAYRWGLRWVPGTKD